MQYLITFQRAISTSSYFCHVQRKIITEIQINQWWVSCGRPVVNLWATGMLSIRLSMGPSIAYPPHQLKANFDLFRQHWKFLQK